MKRREFIYKSSLLIGSGLVFASQANAKLPPLETMVQDLEKSNVEKDCQSIQKNEFAAAEHEIRPKNHSGILAQSIGCRSPHKHLVFIDAIYLSNPDLIEQEADAKTEDGVSAKIFHTSTSFDMSWMVKNVVGAHRHDLLLTAQDLKDLQQGKEIKRIAYQKNFPWNNGIEPGHLFVLNKRKSV